MRISEDELFTNETICNQNFMEYLKIAKTNKERTEVIGKTLQSIRTSAGFTQKQVSQLLAVSVQAYSGYENGKHEPTVEALVRLSYLYEVSTDYLCGKQYDIVDSLPIDTNVIDDMQNMNNRIEALQLEIYSIKQEYEHMRGLAKIQRNSLIHTVGN